jgi:uracil-DNA glycosylase
MFSKQKRLEILSGEVSRCISCRLHEGRTQTVFGEGNIEAKVMFVGEAPGQTEDETGRPFVGRAGKLLDNMIASMGLQREDVYIANICKCRPPGNRKPRPDEMSTCRPYLSVQLGTITPKVIVALGNTALEGLTGRGEISKRCGEWEDLSGFKLMPCYHPSALLRNPNWKTPAWNALQKVAKELL